MLLNLILRVRSCEIKLRVVVYAFKLIKRKLEHFSFSIHKWSRRYVFSKWKMYYNILNWFSVWKTQLMKTKMLWKNKEIRYTKGRNRITLSLIYLRKTFVFYHDYVTKINSKLFYDHLNPHFKNLRYLSLYMEMRLKLIYIIYELLKYEIFNPLEGSKI